MANANITAAATSEKIFKIMKDGELFLHTQSEEDVEKFFNSIHGWWAKSYRKVETKTHGCFEALEDRWIFRQFHGASNEYGMEMHTILRELDGTKISSILEGDWLGIASAEGCPKHLVSAASQGL